MREATLDRLCRTLAILLMIGFIATDLVYQVGIYKATSPFVTDPFTYLELFRYEIIQYTLTILAIIYLIRHPKGGLSSTMCVCAFVIAVDCALESYLMLIDFRSIVIDVSFFLEGVLSLVVAAMLFFNTIMFMRGLSKSASLIKYAVLTLLILQALSLIMALRSKESLGTWDTVANSFIFIALLVVLLIMASSKTINQRSIMGNIGVSIRDMRAMMMEEGIGIDRSVAARFSDYNTNGMWCDSYSFALTSFRGANYAMTVCSKGDGATVSISSAENHSAMNSFRFNVTGVWFDTGDVETCDLMRFYGTDGVFIQFIVRNVPPKKPRKVPKFGLIMLVSREVETKTHRTFVWVSERIYRINDRINRLRPKKKNKGEE